MTIDEIISRFSTTPFLFVGSGLTRRYLNLPDWKGLLRHFAECVRDDEFAYSSYENLAKGMECRAGIMPKVAELIQKDYDQKWFADATIRTVEGDALKLIHNGISPFKVELANYLKKVVVLNETYQSEIEKLSEISEKSIAGVITTNYDTFLEDYFRGFHKYVGQSELIFSPIQGVAEIYKIHGSIETPDSIVINEEDYVFFQEKSAYLAAKLMTIFMEYPIVFIGYSIGDSNIQSIIKSIVSCLDMEQVKQLEDRFVFIEYKEGMVGAEATPYTIMIDDKPLTMRKIVLSDFMLLFNALEGKKAKLPVRILRRFKQELYEYTITNSPTDNLRVASIEDERVADEELVLSIGRASEFGLKGLSGLESNELYRDVVISDLLYSADELLEYALPKLLQQNSGKLPVNKYLKNATKAFPEYQKIVEKQDFNSFISNTIRNNRKPLGTYTSVRQIWENEKNNLEKATRLIAYLPEEQMDVTELESILVGLFEEDVNVLQNASQSERTNIKRLIRIYDYLKWGK
ncbi:MAG: hypothetical protein E7291_05425 [Lachnospiraceae bacterium]|nr:hypothetical protein [Lachnospiraceae bacterium]